MDVCSAPKLDRHELGVLLRGIDYDLGRTTRGDAPSANKTEQWRPEPLGASWVSGLLLSAGLDIAELFLLQVRPSENTTELRP